MKVKDLMSKNVITITKFDSIISAAMKMENHDIGFLVITNDKNEVLGVLTDRDIVIRGVIENNIQGIVDDVMTYDSIKINEDEEVTKAIELMGENQIKRLVVVDNTKKAIGVISLSDIARNKYTNKLVNEALYEISIPNPQKDKPIKFLRVDDFPL